MDSNSVQLLEKFGDKLDSYIQTIGTKLGQGTDHYYPILVKQQVLEGYLALIFIVFATVIIYCYFKFLPKNIELVGELDPIGFWAAGFVVAGGILSFILLITVVVNCWNVMKIINPEYYVLMDVLSKIK